MSLKTPTIVVVSQLPPPVHGTTIMTKIFMDGLRNNGFDSRIVQRKFSGKIEDVGKYSLRKVLKIPALSRNLAELIKKEKPDLCIFFPTIYFRSFLVDSYLVSILKKNNVPFVHYFHGIGFQNLEKKPIPGIKLLLRYTLGNAIGGIVLGHRLMYDVDKYISKINLFVLPNGIPDSANENIKNNDDTNKRSVVFLSNLVETKGPKDFLKTASEVLKVRTNVQFLLAGGTRDKVFMKEIESYIKENKIGNNALIIGPIYGDKKEEFLQNADIFLFPTSKDTFPLVNIEAMQWAIPIISTDEGAIPEMVRDGVNGFIVKTHDISHMTSSVIKLLDDITLRLSMGKMGRKIYEENYSIAAYEKSVRQAMDFFISKMKRNSSRYYSCIN